MIRIQTIYSLLNYNSLEINCYRTGIKDSKWS